MAAVNPFAGDASRRFDPLLHWKEDAKNYSPNGAAMFGPNGGEAGLVGNVDCARSIAAFRFFLGYSNITPVYPAGGTYYLNRTPPVYHPKFPRLVCVSVAGEDFGLYPLGIGNGPKSIKNIETVLPALPAGAPTSYNVVDGTSISFMTSYRKTKVTARFAPVPYRMLNDSQINIGNGGDEWKRWVYVNTNPKAELLSLSGFKQRYFEGTGTAAPVSSPSGNDYPSDVGTVLVKCDVEIIWKSVPEEWIFSRDTVNTVDVVPFPRNILLGLGSVNSTNFMNYLAGTLRLDSARLDRSPWPLCAGTESRFNYDVTFGCSFFDPEKGYTGAGPPVKLNRVDGSGEPTDPRGHNCMPWRGNFTASDINAGLWFGASYTGGATDQGLFRKTEFRKLFNSPLNPY